MPNKNITMPEVYGSIKVGNLDKLQQSVSDLQQTVRVLTQVIGNLTPESILQREQIQRELAVAQAKARAEAEAQAQAWAQGQQAHAQANVRMYPQYAGFRHYR